MTTNFGSAPLVLTTTLVKHPSRPGRGGRSLVRMLTHTGDSLPSSLLTSSFFLQQHLHASSPTRFSSSCALLAP